MTGRANVAGRWLGVAVVVWITASVVASAGRAGDEPAAEPPIALDEPETGGSNAGLDATPQPAAVPQSGPEPEPQPAVAEEPEPTTSPSSDPDGEVPPDPTAAETAPTVVAPAPAQRIRLKLDVSGEVFAPAGRDVPPVRHAITVDGRFDFVESSGGGMGGDAQRPTVTRCFRDASAEVRVDGGKRVTTLPADARRLRMVVAGVTPLPCLEAGFLTREELDLLETPFDSLLIDRLLPRGPVAVGDSWSIPADDVAGLLAIDTVESGGLEAKLVELLDGRAEVTVSGIVDGAADGVPAHVVVEGRCRAAADQAEGKGVFCGGITNVAVTIRERREASHVAPGFDVEARLTVARTPVGPGLDVEPDRTAVSDDDRQAADRRRRGAGRPGFVWQRDQAGRYDLVHDARWRPIEDGPDGLVMRLVDRGALVAQASITALPRGSAASPPTIAEVERDLERSLAGQFGRFEHSSEATRSDGARVVRVVATGRADGLPFRWIHAVLTAADGDRIAVTCTFEESSARRFGTADRELVDGVRFPEEGEATAEAAAPGTGAAPRQARAPRESRTP